MATFTNQRAYQSLRGQGVLVTVATDQLDDLQTISKGMIATNASSSKTGRVEHVDYFGNSFLVVPKQPNMDFASASTYGYLAANETVTVV